VATQDLERAKHDALSDFRDMGPGHLNCAQAVVRFSCRVLGLEDDWVILGRYFGGGITRMGSTCGALSGCPLSLGLRDRQLGLSWPDGASPATGRLQDLVRQFEAEFGASTCRDLVGYPITTAEGYDRFRAEGKYESCERYVSWVCDRLYDILTSDG
jgi:Putative redox-active protein (C_GCAxxG_C_C)